MKMHFVTKLSSRLFLPVIFVFFLINSCGLKVCAANVDDALTQGEILLNNHDYNGAVRAFDKSISGNSNDSLAYSYRGLAHLKLNEYQKAIDDCSKAMPLDPNNALVYYYRAAAYLELHAYEKAVQDCTTAIRLVPSQSAVVLIARARAYSGLGQSRNAMDDLEAARNLAREQQPTYHVRVSETKEPWRWGSHNDTDHLIANPEDFGGIEPGFLFAGESGIKSIGFGKQFYIVGETKESLFESSKRGPAQVSSGWYNWRTDLARVMAHNWSDTYPGQGQALIRITKKGGLSIEWLSYVPGADKEDKIFTAPNSRQLYERSIQKVVSDLNGSKELSFPVGSTATEVVALAHFVSDHNLYVIADDLSLLEGLPNTEKDVRISRICSIFDTQNLYDLSDHFRRQLPSRLQHHFIQGSGHRGVISVWPDSCNLFSTPNFKLLPLSPDCLSYAKEFIDNCISTHHFVKAEVAARYVLWASHSDSVFQKGIDAANARPVNWATSDTIKMWKSKMLGTVPNFRTQFAAIDRDMQKPMEKIRDIENPMVVPPPLN